MDPKYAMKIYLDRLGTIIEQAQNITRIVKPAPHHAKDFEMAKEGLDEAREKHRQLKSRLEQ